MKSTWATYFFLWFTATVVQAQVELSATANKTEVEVGEQFQVTFSINLEGNGDVEEFNLPDFEEFKVIGKSTGQNFSMFNGDVSKQLNYTIVLIPTKKGKFKIKKATAVFDGRTYDSNTFTITVKEKSKEEDLPDITKKNSYVFLDVQLNKTELYPNEELIATVKLYAKNFNALRRRTDVDTPELQNFQVRRVTPKSNQRDYHQERVNGQVYVSEEIAQFALLPQESGELIIPPFQLRVAIPVDFFDERIVRVASPKQKVDVNQFPPGAPNNFSGAVGDFELITHIDSNQPQANKSLDVEVELVGTGNFSVIDLPELKVPDDIEVYPPKSRKKFKTSNEGEKGKIADKYVLVPQYGGDYEVPALKFSYFDPEEKKYKTIQSEKVQLSVKGSPKSQPDSINQIATQTEKPTTTQKPDKEKQDSIAFDEKDNGEILTSIEEDFLDKIPFVKTKSKEGKSTYAWFLLLIPAVLLASGFYVYKRKRKSSANSSTNETKVMDAVNIKDLEQIYAQLKSTIKTDKTTYLSESKKLLNAMVAMVNKTGMENIEIEKSRQILTEKISDNFANRWEEVLNQTQIYAYGAGDISSELNNHLEAQEKLINDLKKRKI